MEAQIQQSILADVEYLAPRLNAGDRAEIKANSGSLPCDALLRGFLYSSKCYTLFHFQEPVAMMGVVPDGYGNGIIWMLSSDITSIKRFIVIVAPHVIEDLTEDYCVVGNIIDARQKEHVRWLCRMGFGFTLTTVRGPNGHLFYQFWKPGLEVINV